MKRRFSIIILALSALAALSSCAKSEAEDETVPVDELVPREDISLTRAETEYVQANNTFALELFKNVSAAESGKSMLLSPLSVTFAFGMVNNGAAGKTKDEINATLGFGEDINSMNGFCSKMLKESAKVDPSTIVEIANAAVVNTMDGGKLKDAFVKTVENNYEAVIYNKDFSKDDVKALINKWCSEKTRGMIPELLQDQVKPEEFAYFLNATYFKGIWSSQFNKNDSKKESFILEDGSKTAVNMMHQKAKFNYSSIKGIGEALCLPYGNQAYRMLVFLPEADQTVQDLKASLDIKTWNAFVSYMSGVEVDVKLPSFESEYSTDMAEILDKMGIHQAFQPSADFSEMTSTPVRISKVLQKAKIKVDEQGSEAAAVTSIVMGKNSVSAAPKSVVFHADRPFIYAITEVSTGAIFFIGQFTGK
ncbi:MAG: serpin family protein [Bacteroidales bacterium]|nr:serpin family protein [Bacteroidales bacterium]MBP3269710.1 serpin family protein [Bacteroidales bacterium]